MALNKWIVDEMGQNVFLIFDDSLITTSHTGRKFKFHDEETIYGLEWDCGCSAYFVSGEFTPHNQPFA